MQLRELEAVIADVPIIGILRGYEAVETRMHVDRLLHAGIRVVEVTIQQLDAIPALEAAVEACRNAGAVIGAGSVNTMAHLEAAAAAGVDFTVAPGLDLTIAQAAGSRDITHIPGVATATEAATAWNAGIRLLKVFPANLLTTAWVSAIRAPFPEAQFVATGGLRLEDLPAWQAAGCDAIGVNAKAIPAGWSFESRKVLR